MILDNISFSFHLIKNNKSKSILNAVISFMISFLVLFLLFIGISVKINGVRIAEDVFYSDKKVEIDKLSSDSEYYKKYNDNNYYEIFNSLEKYNDVIDDYYVEFKYKSGFLYNSYPIYNVNFLLENKKIELKYDSMNKLDAYVYVNLKYANKYSIDVGDSLTIPLSNDGRISYDFIVANIFEDKTDLNNDILFDYSFFKNNTNDDIINNLFISKHLHIDINKNKDVSYTIIKTKEIISIVNSFETSNSDYIAKSNQLDNYNNIILAIDILFYVLLTFIIIILLMTIGIISNLVNVLLDVNKKSIGLYKVLGMKNKDICLTLAIEIIIVFIIGFISSIIMEYSLTTFNQFVLNKIMNTILLMFDKYTLDLEKLSYELYMPFYVPMILIVLLSLLMLLFSWSNIKKIVHCNPISLVKKGE